MTGICTSSSLDVYSIVELASEENVRHCERAHADEIIVGAEFSSRVISTATLDHGISTVLRELLSAQVGHDLITVPVPEGFGGRRFFDVFCDLKLHDIPTTVGRAARVVASLGARWMTVHTMGGAAMVAAAVDGLAEGAAGAGLPTPGALGVTVLTSDETATGAALEARCEVAARNGCEGVLPKAQGCCGALMLHSGLEADAAEMARRFIDAFEAEAADVDTIVINAAGCGSTLKQYGHLLRDDPVYAERARALAVKCTDISELLDELEPRAPRHPVPLRIAYHDACHLQHAQGDGRLSDAVLNDPRFAQLARKIRQMFQLALVGVMRNEDMDRNLAYMRKVFAKLEQVTGEAARGPLWRIADALVEGLQEDAIALGTSVKQMLGQIDRTLRELAADGVDSLERPAPTELLKNLLYYVAKADHDSPRIREVRAGFRLDDALPSEDLVNAERERLTGPDSMAMSSVVTALSEELTKIKDALEQFVHQGDSAPATLAPEAIRLKQVSDTVAMLGLGQPFRLEFLSQR